MHVDDNLRAGMTPEQARRQAVLEAGRRRADQGSLPRAEHVPAARAPAAGRSLRAPPARQEPGLHRHRRPRPGPRPGRQRRHLRLRGCRAAPAAALRGSHAPGERDRERAADSARRPVLSRLSRLEAPQHRLHLLDVYNGRRYMLQHAAGTELVPGARVSDGFFRTLGVAPSLGREFHDGEDLPGAPQTVILSLATWRDRFGGRPDVIGQVVTLNDMPHTVDRGAAAGVPLRAAGAGGDLDDPSSRRRPATSGGAATTCRASARLEDGVSVEAALAEMKSIAARLEARVSRLQPRPGRERRAAVRGDRGRRPSAAAGAARAEPPCCS